MGGDVANKGEWRTEGQHASSLGALVQDASVRDASQLGVCVVCFMAGGLKAGGARYLAWQMGVSWLCGSSLHCLADMSELTSDMAEVSSYASDFIFRGHVRVNLFCRGHVRVNFGHAEGYLLRVRLLVSRTCPR
jgi:hypothetical protein